MTRETTTEYEVQTKEQEVEIIYCDNCASKIGPVDGDTEPIDVAINPDFETTVENDVKAWDRRKLAISITEDLTGVDCKAELDDDLKTLIASSSIMGEASVDEAFPSEIEVSWSDEIFDTVESTVDSNVREYVDSWNSSVDAQVDVDAYEEWCITCANKFGVDVPKSVYDVNKRESLEEEVEKLRNRVKGVSGLGNDDERNVLTVFLSGFLISIILFILSTGEGNTIIDSLVMSAVSGFIVSLFVTLSILVAYHIVED